MAEMNFESVEPFGIDGGELDGLTPQQCFTLGVEWQMVADAAERPEAFARPVHAANRDRLAKVLDRRGRVNRMTFMRDDVSESWMWLAVEPKEE